MAFSPHSPPGDRLAAMGITRWVRRDAPAAAASGDPPAGATAPLPQVLLNPPGASVMVVIDVPALDLRGDTPEAQLLRDILRALAAPVGTFAVLASPAGEVTAAACRRQLPFAPRLTFWFADAPPDADDTIIVLPSLPAMVSNPAAKRPAWEQMKPWVGKL